MAHPPFLFIFVVLNSKFISMDKNLFIELVLKNGERRIVNKSLILSVSPAVDGCLISLSGEPVAKLAVSPSYSELLQSLTPGSKEE